MKPHSPYFAAIDLGSNSFHMLIARVQDGRADIVDREREMVQLAKGIKADGYLSVAAQVRALDCLRRFAERLREIPVPQIRAVGTKTLRAAAKPDAFIKKAEAVLSAPIQIISGYEEARLVYCGLSHSVRNDHRRRLVVDIGGGSTEIIIGRDYEPISMESLNMGCVTYAEKFIAKSKKLSAAKMRKARLAAGAELEPYSQSFQARGWEIAYGTSGTVRAIADLTTEKDGGALITRESLDWLAGEIIDSKDLLAALPALRRPILPAGVAILQAVFEQLNVDAMHVEDAALKEGLLYDTIGRLGDRDLRDLAVQKLQDEYGIDLEQARRVSETANRLWRQIDGPVLPRVSRTKVLTWAAQLHEIGLRVSHSGHHQHGYYLLRHGDIAGFGRYEQYILANLVRSHRKGLYPEEISDLDESALAAFLPLLVCLRIAALLHRSREDLDQAPKLSVHGNVYRLLFAKGWLKQRPLTLAGLKYEKEQWERIGVGLSFE